MHEWMSWTILFFSALGGAGSVIRIGQNERHHRFMKRVHAKKHKKKK